MGTACAEPGHNQMLTERELLRLMSDLESFRVERTSSTSNTDKFREAICAFANDMPGSRLCGYLLIGVDDKTGQPTGLKITDELLQQLANYASDGTILPAPALTAWKQELSSGAGEIAVVEVHPHHLPPVRYKGRICVRTAPRRGFANESQEQILTERRVATLKPFDNRPCLGAALTDLVLDLFLTTYRSQAVAREVIEENHRSIEDQMASLRLYDLKAKCPTHSGILLFAKDPLQWIPHAYVEYVRFSGKKVTDEVLLEKRFSGDLLTMLRSLDEFLRQIPDGRPKAVSLLQEAFVVDYPEIAIRELVMNAVMHRSYEAASPIRFFQFSDRLEIHSPGPLYGEATRENFPRQTSYRNPTVAEALKVLGFVNRFGRGVMRAQDALRRNGNPEAEFEFGDTYFVAKIPARP